MAVLVSNAPISWDFDRDEETHRTYHVTFRVQVSSPLDGPAQILTAPGLPRYGDVYAVGTDVDTWAFCRWPVRIKPEVTGEPSQFWQVTYLFSTKPDKALCLLDQEQNPLLIPPKVSGQSVNYTEEAVQDRFGNPIISSSWEQIRGPQVEFDKNRHRIHIEMNVASLQLPFVNLFCDKVNSVPIWGMRPRCVKLSVFTWDRNFYGACFPYYTWKFDFDLREDTFDRDIMDEGTKVLNGHWSPFNGNWVLDNIGGNPPDPSNPQHFIRYQDRLGNTARVLLDGYGIPAGVFIGTGTGGTPRCGACTGNQTISSALIAPSVGGHFLGEYAVYEGVVNGQPLLPLASDPCTLVYAAGNTLIARVTIIIDGTNKTADVVLFIDSPPGAVNPAPSLQYAAKDIPLVGGKIDCSVARIMDLEIGDINNCPVSFTLAPTVTTIPGPIYSGPVAYRHLEKYDEIDLSLLGVPLNF